MKIFNTCSSARNKKRKFTTIALGRKNDEKSFSVGEKPNSSQEEELPKTLREEFRNGNERSLQCCGAKNPRKGSARIIFPGIHRLLCESTPRHHLKEAIEECVHLRQCEKYTWGCVIVHLLKHNFLHTQIHPWSPSPPPPRIAPRSHFEELWNRQILNHTKQAAALKK